MKYSLYLMLNIRLFCQASISRFPFFLLTKEKELKVKFCALSVPFGYGMLHTGL